MLNYSNVGFCGHMPSRLYLNTTANTTGKTEINADVIGKALREELNLPGCYRRELGLNQKTVVISPRNEEVTGAQTKKVLSVKNRLKLLEGIQTRRLNDNPSICTEEFKQLYGQLLSFMNSEIKDLKDYCDAYESKAKEKARTSIFSTQDALKKIKKELGLYMDSDDILRREKTTGISLGNKEIIEIKIQLKKLEGDLKVSTKGFKRTFEQLPFLYREIKELDGWCDVYEDSPAKLALRTLFITLTSLSKIQKELDLCNPGNCSTSPQMNKEIVATQVEKLSMMKSETEKLATNLSVSMKGFEDRFKSQLSDTEGKINKLNTTCEEYKKILSLQKKY